MKLFVQALENAHSDVCRLLTLEFETEPTVRQVLERLQQTPVGVKILLWGEQELDLDTTVGDGDLLVVTDQAAERLRELLHARAERDRSERRRQGIQPHYL